MIGRRTEAVLNRAVKYAVECQHEYFTLEHVLWSLLAEEDVIETIKTCGGNAETLRLGVAESLEKEVPKAAPIEPLEKVDKTDGADKPAGPIEHPVATLGIQRLIQRALFHVQAAGKTEVQPIDLFVALFQAKDSQALYLLNKQGLERLDVLNFVSHGLKSDSEDGSSGDSASGEEEAPERQAALPKKAEDPLKVYATDLNDRARAGKIDPLVGRKSEIERMIQTLCRRRKNNPLLVGEAGVGKTALAEGLALRIVEGNVPDLLQNTVIYSLDLGSLIAGAKFRGDFEQRLKRVLNALKKKKEQGRDPILFIDEIHTIIGAGAVSGGALDAANLLKPLLSQGEVRCIGSTTYLEFRNVFEKDHALARRFQKIDVLEPSVDEAIQILMGLKSKFEEHHDVKYSSEAIRAAVELSSKYFTDRFLPDKAIDVMDEAGARARLKAEKGKLIDAKLIEEMVAQIARIPARAVSISQKSRLKNMDRDLKLSIFGQDHAVEALVTSIRLARSGLRTGEKPVGSFLFCGPTGVGKTELTKQLAHCLGVPFLRFDMSEYGEKHTVSRLIGAPPGYVGFEQAGLLTDAVLKNPHAVVLLDEVEKAHTDIWNILLQVMDHGFLTDNNGRKADFRNVVIVMTSNVGSREMERRSLGISTSDAKSSEAQRAVERTFSPEFRNRLDSIIYFNPLSLATIGQVVGKQIVELESQLLSKGVDIDITSDAREWLAVKGYDKTLGARPMSRLIQDKIKKPLSEEILFGKLEFGGEVKVLVKDGELEFKIKGKPAPTPKTESDPGAGSAPVEEETHHG